jgi:hypothetical protein
VVAVAKIMRIYSNYLGSTTEHEKARIQMHVFVHVRSCGHVYFKREKP